MHESKKHRFPPHVSSSAVYIYIIFFSERRYFYWEKSIKAWLFFFFFNHVFKYRTIVLKNSYQHWEIYSTQWFVSVVSMYQSQTLLLHNCSIPWKKYIFEWSVNLSQMAFGFGGGGRTEWPTENSDFKILLYEGFLLLKKGYTVLNSWK